MMELKDDDAGEERSPEMMAALMKYEQTLTIDRRGHGSSELGAPLLNPGASRPRAPPRADAWAPVHARVVALPGRDVVSPSAVSRACRRNVPEGELDPAGFGWSSCVWQPSARRVWAHAPRRTDRAAAAHGSSVSHTGKFHCTVSKNRELRNRVR